MKSQHLFIIFDSLYFTFHVLAVVLIFFSSMKYEVYSVKVPNVEIDEFGQYFGLWRTVGTYKFARNDLPLLVTSHCSPTCRVVPLSHPLLLCVDFYLFFKNKYRDLHAKNIHLILESKQCKTHENTIKKNNKNST